MKNKIKLLAVLFCNLLFSQTQETSFSKGLEDGWNETLKEAKNIDIYSAGGPNHLKCSIYPGYAPNDKTEHQKEYSRGYRCGVEQATKIIPVLQQKLQNKTFGSDKKINTNNENIDYSNSDKNTDKFKNYSEEFSNYINNLNNGYTNNKLIDYGKPINLYPQNNNNQPNYNINYTEEQLKYLKYKNNETHVINSCNPYVKLSERIIKNKNQEIKKKSKENLKELKNKIQYNIDSLKNGWYEAFVSFDYNFDKKTTEKTTFKRKVLVNNGKIEYYIGNMDLVYKINYFFRFYSGDNYSPSKYNLSFINPDSTYGKVETYEISFLSNEPLNELPSFKLPKSFIVYSNTNLTSEIFFNIYDKDKNFVMSSFFYPKKTYTEPSCNLNEGVGKLFLPEGEYIYYAITTDYQNFWNGSIVIKNTCQKLNLTN